MINTSGQAWAIVLGLGNDLLGDDGIGLRVAREIRNLGLEGVEAVESGEAGLALLELLSGYETAVIVDAIQTGAPVGTIHLLDRSSFDKVVAPSAHYAGLPEVFALGERLSINLPSRTVVIAVEVADPYAFSESLTPQVEATVERAIQSVLAALGKKVVTHC